MKRKAIQMLMLSPLYFRLTLRERLELVNQVVSSYFVGN